MLVHLAVPVNFSSAFPSRPTSTYCAIYVPQYWHDFANYECSVDTFATQRETRKVYVCRMVHVTSNLHFSAELPYR